MISNKRENIIIIINIMKYRKKLNFLELGKVQKVIKYIIKRKKIL